MNMITCKVRSRKWEGHPKGAVVSVRDETLEKYPRDLEPVKSLKIKPEEKAEKKPKHKPSHSRRSFERKDDDEESEQE